MKGTTEQMKGRGKRATPPKRTAIPDGHTTIRNVYSPDDGGWYAVKSTWSQYDGHFFEWTTRDIYPSEDDLQMACRLRTVIWEGE